jgi:hypothetical protein
VARQLAPSGSRARLSRLTGLRAAPVLATPVVATTVLATTVLATTVLATSLVGCSRVDATLSRQSADVTFRQGTRAAVIAQIEGQCRHLSGIGMRQVHGAGDQVTGISLQAGAAGVFSRRQLSDIYSCLARFPAVTGVSVGEVSP